jgi:hypothetical protein
MSDTIKAAHDRATQMAKDLRASNPNVSFMFGSVCYRDPVDAPNDVHEVHPLDANMDNLVRFLGNVKASGGGDGPEDWAGAYSLALEKMHWRAGAKTIIHIADAPAHGREYCGATNHEEESPKLRPLIEAVARRGILLSCIDINYGAACSFSGCKDIYEAAGGCKFKIERFTFGTQFDTVLPSPAPLPAPVPAPRPAPRPAGAPVPFLAASAAPPSASCGKSAAAPPRARQQHGIGPLLEQCARHACEEALDLFYG